MYFELLGSFVEAEQLYQKELENDPTNAMVLKRMVGWAGVHACAWRPEAHGGMGSRLGWMLAMCVLAFKNKIF